VHPRDGPVAAANEKIENWEKVGAITIDERKDNICKGRVLGEGSGEFSHAQMQQEEYSFSSFLYYWLP
jgi:hypothetical protein